MVDHPEKLPHTLALAIDISRLSKVWTPQMREGAEATAQFVARNHNCWDEVLKHLERIRQQAIATEARRAETVEQGSVHEGAGPKDIAQ